HGCVLLPPALRRPRTAGPARIAARDGAAGPGHRARQPRPRAAALVAGHSDRGHVHDGPAAGGSDALSRDAGAARPGHRTRHGGVRPPQRLPPLRADAPGGARRAAAAQIARHQDQSNPARLPIRRPPPVRPAAQVPPHENWQTLRTDRFRITFSPGLEALARHAAERAEAAYAQLARELGPPPRGTIDVLITANADIANGFAMPFPSNRIVVYATPPVDDLGLAYTRDWVELVIAHELVHIFQMDRAGLLGRVVRGVFGRVPFGWPLFPVIGTPQWSIEGLATYYESRLTGLGRAHGALHEMMLRTAVLEGRFESIDQASGFGPQWPTGLRPYVYGSMFLAHLARRHGPEVMREIVGLTAGAVIPPTLAFDRIGRKATGESFTAEWRAWRRELETRYARLADSLRAEG